MNRFIDVETWRVKASIAAHAVSFEEFREFARATGYTLSREVRPASEAEQAVVGASRLDANAYCAWLSEREGASYQLPSVEELDALLDHVSGGKLDATVWAHEPGRLPEVIGGLKPLWLCEWTRDADDQGVALCEKQPSLTTIFYPPWLRDGSHAGRMHAGLLASEGYSFVTFRVCRR